ALVSGPMGFTVAGAGAIAWTPTEAQGPSTNLVTVRVFDDGVPSLSATQSFTIVLTEVNTAPVLATIADRSVNEGTTLSVSTLANDTDIPANLLTYGIASAPPGVTMNANTGLL